MIHPHARHSLCLFISLSVHNADCHRWSPRVRSLRHLVFGFALPGQYVRVGAQWPRGESCVWDVTGRPFACALLLALLLFIGMDCIRALRRWMNLAMTTKAGALRGRVSVYVGEGTLHGTALRNETQAQADRQAAGANQTKHSGPRYAAHEISSLFVYTPT